MKRLIAIGLSLFIVNPCWATWTMVQQVFTNSTFGVTCTPTPSSVTAGNALVVIIGGHDGSLANDAITSVTSVGDTWSAPATSMYVQHSGGNFVDMWYLPSAAGGETAIVASTPFASTIDCYAYEINNSLGTAIFDNSGTGSGGPSSIFTGVANTLSGTNDFIIQNIFAAAASSIDTGYTNLSTFGLLNTATLLNSAVGTAPTWSLFSSANAAYNALAFKDSAGATPKKGSTLQLMGI